MAESDLELRDEVREYLGGDEVTISESQLRVALRRAKRHIVSRKRSLNTPQEVNWYATGEPFQEALFWWTCLFGKIIIGELDAPDGMVGDIEVSHLKASNTEVYKQATEALNRIDPQGRYGITRVNRGGDTGDSATDTEL